MLVQCTQPPIDDTKETTAALQTVTRDGYAFELFATPEQQLQYSRTWATDPNKKRVALELLIERFPDAKAIRADAELELAYLALGADYRFADSAACQRALAKYQRIASQYTDLPSVCAKAHWYMGWIFADLLKQRRKAIDHYQMIIDHYPDATLSSIALLEIIRKSENEDEKWIAFEKLWSGDRTSLAMGYAFRALVNDSPSLAQKVATRANIYLDAELFSRPIAEEVRIALESRKLRKKNTLSEQEAQRMQ